MWYSYMYRWILLGKDFKVCDLFLQYPHVILMCKVVQVLQNKFLKTLVFWYMFLLKNVQMNLFTEGWAKMSVKAMPIMVRPFAAAGLSLLSRDTPLAPLWFWFSFWDKV